MMGGFAIGGFVGAGIGIAFVAINVVGFPEAEIVEAGTAAWILNAAVAEPGGSLAIGALTGGAIGGGGGLAAGLAISSPTGCGG